VSPSQILTLTEALEESQVTVKVHQEQLEEERRVRAKFIGNYRNLQEFAGICRNLQEFAGNDRSSAGICRKWQEFCKIVFLVHCGLNSTRRAQGESKIDLQIRAFHRQAETWNSAGIHRNMQEVTGILQEFCRSLQEVQGICGNLQEFAPSAPCFRPSGGMREFTGILRKLQESMGILQEFARICRNSPGILQNGILQEVTGICRKLQEVAGILQGFKF
jgi:hypothetical protein